MPILVPGLLDSVRPMLHSCQITCAAMAALIPPSQFWRWKEMWTNSLRTAIFSAALVEFLATGKLISLPEVCQILGSKHCFLICDVCIVTILSRTPVKDEWKGRFALPVEDYLHGLISLVNELVSKIIHRFSLAKGLPR